MKVNESEEPSLNEAGTDPKPVETPQGNRRLGLGLGLFVLGLAIAGLIGWFVYKGISTRVLAAKALIVQTHNASVLTVSITHPKLGAAAQQLVLPGNTQAFIDAPIYARISGYLKKWYADIGSHVHQGEILAEIEAPEADQQLRQAQADLETAKSNLNLAQVTATRILTLQKRGVVARQEGDNATADLDSKRAVVDSAAANVKRLQDLQSYEKIYAPFDGVITARNTDIGALIDAGSSAGGKELFHISAINKLRVFISVPEDYEQVAKIGSPATLELNEFPGRSFRGTIVRTSNSIDMSSRTLLVEVDVDNPTGELLPGAYVAVHLKFAGALANALTIPVTTVMFRSEGIRAAVVRGGRAMLVPITVGRDFGDSLEILAGLRRQDQLIVNPPDSLISGAPVRITATVPDQK
jgi:RND family efflux transporter MFP subunit